MIVRKESNHEIVNMVENQDVTRGNFSNTLGWVGCGGKGGRRLNEELRRAKQSDGASSGHSNSTEKKIFFFKKKNFFFLKCGN
jgi:hypothetical protein